MREKNNNSYSSTLVLSEKNWPYNVLTDVCPFRQKVVEMIILAEGMLLSCRWWSGSKVVGTISSVRTVCTSLTPPVIVVDCFCAESERKRSNCVRNGVKEAVGVWHNRRLGLLLRMEQVLKHLGLYILPSKSEPSISIQFYSLIKWRWWLHRVPRDHRRKIKVFEMLTSQLQHW